LLSNQAQRTNERQMCAIFVTRFTPILQEVKLSGREAIELKPYCTKLSMFTEGGVPFFSLEGLRLPAGCEPQVCDALLCPVTRDNYPSRLQKAEKIVYRHPDATRFLPNSGKRSCSIATCVILPQT